MVQVLRRQHGICPFCGNKISIRDADPHHWAYKRSANVPDVVLHSPNNIVIACAIKCHRVEGQTKETTALCLKHKLALGYDIYGWIDQIIKDGLMINRPDIYGI